MKGEGATSRQIIAIRKIKSTRKKKYIYIYTYLFHFSELAKLTVLH